MASRAVIWRAPFTAIEALQLLPGGVNSDALYCSSDGQVILGWADDADGIRHAVKWDKTTLAVTQLPNLNTPPEYPDFAFACSPDASIIFAHTTDFSAHVVRYTGGGAGGTVLAPPSGYAIVNYPSWDVRFCSDDGIVSCGQVSTGGVGGATRAARYDTTTPTALPVVISGSDGYAARCISEDAAVIVGDQNLHASGFWRGTTAYRLYLPPTVSLHLSNAYACNANGSIIWGSCTDASLGEVQHACYWDNLTTLNGDGSYGTVHFLSGLAGSSSVPWNITWCAERTDTPVAVGYSVDAVGATHAAKWIAATITDLPPMASASFAYGCSSDGALVVGQSGETDSTQWPAYWNTAVDTTPHILPKLAGETEGRANGASRDASLIYGFVLVGGTTLTDAELFFQPQTAFIDLSVESTRRLYVSTGGTPQWMGQRGEIPSGGAARVYLSTLGPPADFTANNGDGGSFPVSGTIGPADGPGCTPYYITEASTPASNPEWRLTVSDDGGRTWSRLVKPRAIGKIGEYLARLRWQKMGQSRERMIKLECTDPTRRNIIGVYIDADQGMG